MKHYPKIEYYNKGLYGRDIIGFDKLDGSNIRCEWSRKRGWYKFGTKSMKILGKLFLYFWKNIMIRFQEYLWTNTEK